MRKSDHQLRQDVIEELRWDPQVGKAEVGVAAKDGVVTLSGLTDTYAQKLAIERAATRVSGVRAVARDLFVRPFDANVRTDAEIAHAVVNALRWDTRVPEDRIKVNVEDGWVTLEGDATWKYQAEAAERAVRYLSGVRGVSNAIVVRSGPSEITIRSKIESALKRSAEVDAKHIQVHALDGKVTLSGSVRSWAERADAEKAAWAAPGVRQVEDLLAVTY
jgi:osmotically-inducible protein OsmY